MLLLPSSSLLLLLPSLLLVLPSLLLLPLFRCVEVVALVIVIAVVLNVK